MIKMSLLGFIATILFTASCVRTIEHNPPPIMHIEEIKNSILSIENCAYFVSNSEYPIQALTAACKSAGFESDDLNHESISSDVYVIHIYGKYGYAALWVDHKDGSCVIEFYCKEDRYDYASFIAGFMQEFDAVQTKKEWYQTFTDLLG